MQTEQPSPATNRVVWLVPVLLVLFAVQAIGSMVQKSVTVDEITYITAGYYHLRTGDFRYNQTNPALMKMVAALPLLACDLDRPVVPDESPVAASQSKDWQVARRFLYQNRTDADKILLVARLPIVFLATLLGWLVWRWTQQLYGEAAGLVALVLFCFSPNILAHARLATQDLGLTATMFGASYFFWRYLHRPAWGSLLLCGVSCGLALAAKTPAVLLAPILASYACLCIFRNNGLGVYKVLPGVMGISPDKPRLRQTWSLLLTGGALSVVALVTLNFVYAFEGTFADTVKGIPCPLPAAYLHGLRFQASLSDDVGGVYLAGRMYPDGLWYKLPLTMLIKTPLPLLFGLALSGGAMLRAFRTLDVEWLFAAFIACFLLVFSLSSVDGGLRYLLPIFPFFFLVAGRLAQRGISGWMRFCLVAIVAWSVVSAVGIYPHYLPYCNELIGPANGYKLLTDSDIDWGQDLKGLKHYMDEHNIDTIKLGYFGSADADYYGIDYEYLPSVGLAPKKPGQLWFYEMGREPRDPLPPQKGTIAVSATLLAAPRWMRPLFFDDYGWLRGREPIGQVGYSILIYQID